MRHYVDCNQGVTIGDYATIAGLGSQILSHSIDLYANRQDAREIRFGNYVFVGTRCIILGGATLPNFSVLGAGSLLKDRLETEFRLYAGVPALEKKILSSELAYFNRDTGFVD